jgi:hypothetical protein
MCLLITIVATCLQWLVNICMLPRGTNRLLLIVLFSGTSAAFFFLICQDAQLAKEYSEYMGVDTKNTRVYPFVSYVETAGFFVFYIFCTWRIHRNKIF